MAAKVISVIVVIKQGRKGDNRLNQVDASLSQHSNYKQKIDWIAREVKSG